MTGARELQMHSAPPGGSGARPPLSEPDAPAGTAPLPLPSGSPGPEAPGSPPGSACPALSAVSIARSAAVEKSAGGAPITDGDLAAIRRYTLRPMEREELYAFSLILCDNEVDRDWERFSDEALATLGELFVGRTGVFDHRPLAAGQAARIFDTALVREERQNSLGDPYLALRARAYMVRGEHNAGLIREIDGGIKKEVSVGCAVGAVLCSICGADQRQGACGHEKGKRYGEALCHHRLEQPTDAYEWSFVAVPAQRSAGVVKAAGRQAARLGDCRLEKLFACRGDLLLTAEQLARLGEEYRRLEGLARLGRESRAEKQAEALRLALLAQPDLEPAILEQAFSALEEEQLAALAKSFRRAAARRYPLRPQLAPADREAPPPAANSPYRM